MLITTNNAVIFSGSSTYTSSGLGAVVGKYVAEDPITSLSFLSWMNYYSSTEISV
jgi:hypothetical protein